MKTIRGGYGDCDFHPKGMSLAQFEETHQRLAAVGSAESDGRIHHSCFGDDGDLMVYDIWESPEKFEAFGGVVMPTLGELGIDVGEPSIMALHRVDQSSAKQEGS